MYSENLIKSTVVQEVLDINSISICGFYKNEIK